MHTEGITGMQLARFTAFMIVVYLLKLRVWSRSFNTWDLSAFPAMVMGWPLVIIRQHLKMTSFIKVT